jgi:hypothetical protein
MSDIMKNYPNLNKASAETKKEVASLLSSLVHSLEYEGTPDKYLVGYREIIHIMTGEAKSKTPIYVHDCEKCTFLETIIIGLNAYDIYEQCYKGLTEQSYVYRYSDDGPDYFSGTKEMCLRNAEANKEVKL